MNFWNCVQHVIFERGISLAKQEDGSWQCISDVGDGFPLEPTTVQNELNLRLITATDGKIGFEGEPRFFIISVRNGKYLDFELAELQQLISYPGSDFKWFLKTKSLFYLLMHDI